MGLDIYFSEDVADRLEALRLTNERALRLAEDLGADTRDIALVRAAILGTLADVAVSFGLHRQGLDFRRGWIALNGYLTQSLGQKEEKEK